MKGYSVVLITALMAIIHISQTHDSATAQDPDSDVIALKQTLGRLEAVLRYYEQLLVRNLLAETELPRLAYIRRLTDTLRSRLAEAS